MGEMSDLLAKRLELITEEVEAMGKSKLFEEKETGAILAKRKKFELEIEEPTRDIKTFIAYITYERNLLRDIQQRKRKCKQEGKTGGIERRIIHRVKVLYEIALQLFSDSSLFSSFLAFCLKVNYLNAAEEAVSKMLMNHPENPEVWCVAAKWQAYSCNDTHTAMTTLLKGVALHNDSQLLYKQMIKIELLESEKFDLTSDDDISPMSSEKKCTKNMEKILKAVFENINDCKFYIDILEILGKNKYTMQTQEIIIEYLLKNHSDDENVWHALAQRERQDVFPKTESTQGPSTSTEKRRTPKAKLQACFAKYEVGLSTVPASNRRKMWILFIDFLLKLQEEPQGAGTILKLETLKACLKRACKEGCLTEKQYVMWLKYVEHDEAVKILEQGTNTIPDSVLLWKARLKIAILKYSNDDVNKVFKMGIFALKEKALPLWELILQYHYVSSDDKYVELIYKDGLKQPAEISSALKSKYIEWLVTTKGTDAAREAYKRFAEEKPYCKTLHRTMARLELIEMDNFETWGQVHKFACEQFGNEDVDVWINHIQFYLLYNNKIPDLKERVEELHKKALESLSNELTSAFESKYKNIALLQDLQNKKKK